MLDQSKNRLAILSILLLALAGCESSDPAPPALPHLFFILDASAEMEVDGITVTCSLEYIVEIAGEVSRSNDVVEYVGTMGGGASRSLRNPDQSGVDFFADAFSEVQVLLLVPNRVQINQINLPPDPPGVSSRFWDEQRRFDGILIGDRIEGDWNCAPLDTDIGGVSDDTIFAEGTWSTLAVDSG